MRPSKGQNLYELLANNLIDILSVLVVAAALWQLAHNGLSVGGLMKKGNESDVASKTAWWRTIVVGQESHDVTETPYAATANPAQETEKPGSFWGLFAGQEEEEEVADKPEAVKTAEAAKPQHPVITERIVKAQPAPTSQPVTVKDVPVIIPQQEEEAGFKFPSFSGLQSFFTFYEFEETPAEGSTVWEDLPKTDYGIAQFLKSLKHAAEDGSKYAGELLARWAESEVMESNENPTSNGEKSILQKILATQDADETVKETMEWKKVFEPVTPFLQALSSAAQAGSASAGELLKAFFKSLVEESAPESEATDIQVGTVFADYFLSANIAEGTKEEMEGSSAVLKSFFTFLDSAARGGVASAKKLIDDLLKAEMEAAREVDKPKEEEDVKGSGNVFSEFFVPLTGDIHDGQAASDTSAAVFFQYLYDAAKLGSSSAADLIAQWVGAADEDGATSKGAEFLAAFIAPQGDDTVVSKEAKPEKQDGVFANFFGGDEEDTEATINTNYGNILKNWLNLEDWGIPEDMKVAISQVFGDESGEAESGDMKSQSQGLISPKDTRYISLLKKKLRQLELRGRGKGLSRPLLASGEKFTFRRAVQAATKTIAKAEPSIVKAKAESSVVKAKKTKSIDVATASNKNSFIPTSAAVSTKAPVVTSSSAVSQEPRSTEKPQANKWSNVFAAQSESFGDEETLESAGFDFNIKEFLSSVRADSLADHLSNLVGRAFSHNNEEESNEQTARMPGVWSMFATGVDEEEDLMKKEKDTFKEEKPLNWVRGNPEVVRQQEQMVFYQDVNRKLEADRKRSTGSSSCLMGWYGVDPTYDKWCAEKCASGSCSSDACTCGRSKSTQVSCADNRYNTKEGSSFLCQASCNQPPFNCPSAHCTCVNPEARLTSGDSAGRCVSPRTCKTQEYTAVPGTYATDSWCASVCSPSSPSNELCSCTLCECSITCGSGIPNGDFEQGLKGWSLVRQRGSRGATITTLKSTAEDYEHNDIRGPLSGKTIPAIPPSRASSSSRMAVMDFASPGSLILYREYTPVKGDIIKFRWAAVNWARDFYVQYDTTSANVVRNQHFRVDIIDATAASSIRKPMNWFETTSPTNFRETSTSSILASALSPDKVKNVMNAIGEPPFRDSEPWQTSRFDLSPFAGRKLLVVFRAVANQGPMSVVIDDVGIVNDACTPPTHNLAASPFISRLPDPVAVDVDGTPCSDVCGLEFSK